MRISVFCTERVERWLDWRDGFLGFVGDEVDMTLSASCSGLCAD